MKSRSIQQLAFSIAVAVFFCSCGGESFVQIHDTDTSQHAFDSLSYTPEKINLTEGNCNQPESSCLVILMEYPVFPAENAAGNAINAWIRRQISFVDERGNVPDQRTYARQLADMFLEDQKSMGTDMMSWSIENTAGIHFENRHLISVFVSSNSFTGGAHPNSSTSYASFNKTTGKQLGISDIVKDSIQFAKTCEIHFRSQNGFKQDADLYELGFEFGEDGFYINNNFYLTDRSIVFLYNNYEIGPYAIGSWSFSVPYAEIPDLLQADFKLMIGIPES